MKYIFGNWKMYLSHKEAITLAVRLKDISYDVSEVTVGVFPSLLSLVGVKNTLAHTAITIGAQHVAWTPVGPYTGAVSAALVHDVGATHTLVGHSERRHIFGESNDNIRKRVEAAIVAGLIPVLCIGETQEDLAQGKREYRLKKQLMKALAGLDIAPDGLIVAYEPVWAISHGSNGKPCMPADTEEVHVWIKKELEEYNLQRVPVLYGGSVNAENVVSYMSLPSVDGVLVGSASTKGDVFSTIIAAGASM